MFCRFLLLFYQNILNKPLNKLNINLSKISFALANTLSNFTENTLMVTINQLRYVIAVM